MALLLYYRLGWLQLKPFDIDKKNDGPYTTFITVIVPARNEEANIENCIRSILQQSYSSNLFEIIVINDHSTDATEAVVKSFTCNNVRLINLADCKESSNINSYKKKAIETGISVANGTLIITTDADCFSSNKWLETMAAYYEDAGSAFIAAPVAYYLDIEKNSVANKFFQTFQSLDFMMLQGITAASVHKKVHNMCNGANLAYEKNAFLEVDGFKNIDSIASGDDMLLMHKIQKKYPDKISYLKSNNAIVYTRPAGNITEFINQRIRWASKADTYPDIKITLVLFLVYVFNGWLFFLAIDSLLNLTALYFLLSLLFAKTCVELFFLFPVAKFFKQRNLLWWLLPAQPLHIIYILIAGWLGKFGSYTWKDRKVK